MYRYHFVTKEILYMYRQNTNFLTPQTPRIIIKYELFPHLLVTLIIMIVT